MTTRANQLGASLHQAYQHWRERGALETLSMQSSHDGRPRLTIAISRERGAGGASIAKKLAERLEWPLYDRELLQHIADQTGVQEALLKDLDEQRPSWFSEILKSLGTEKNIAAAGYAALLHKNLAALYVRGNCIILGRGAAQVLPGDRTIRVRLIAPFEFRVHRMTTLLPSGEDVVKHVKQVDKDRRSFVKEYFNKDPDNFHDYDLTINTSRFDLENCCELIEQAMMGRIATLQSP